MGGKGDAAARRGHTDGRSPRSSLRRGGSCDLPATLAPARHAAEDRRFQLFVPFVLLRITCYFEMILSSNGCRWALLCASARAKYAKSCHLFSLARLQKPRLRPFRHNGAVDFMRLELARGSSCKRYRARAMRLRLKSRKISRAALWPGAPVTPPPGWPPEPHK